MSVSENTLAMPPNVHVSRHREFVSAFVNLIEFRGFEKACLDFSATNECFQEAVLPIVALVRRYAGEGVAIELKLPRHERLRRLFINCNWAHLMCPQEFGYFSERQDLNLPARSYRDETEQYAFVRDVVDRILRVTSHLDRSHLRALEWSLNEVSDNVLLHANSDLGGIGQLSIRPNSREVEFVIADAGIGIPKSLRSSSIEGADKWDDYEALQQATREGVTRGVGQGNGLFGSLRVSTLSGGAFSINSGFAMLYGSRDGSVHGRVVEQDFPGTSVTCAISYAQPLVLEEALKFEGRAVRAPMDMIEDDYEGFDDDVVPFEVAKETVSVGNRRLGYELRKKIENISRLGEISLILIDLKGLPVMASSFADEAIAKLVVHYGPTLFKRRFRLVNADMINQQIIERSVKQRLESEGLPSASIWY